MTWMLRVIYRIYAIYRKKIIIELGNTIERLFCVTRKLQNIIFFHYSSV